MSPPRGGIVVSLVNTTPLYSITIDADHTVRLIPGPDFSDEDVDQAVEAVGAVQDALR